ncbi:MAG TPA: pitrilysin family protein [Planctomycetota bacterium]|nr:pitrilysin family protein [Planctomycetota bacterium]
MTKTFSLILPLVCCFSEIVCAESSAPIVPAGVAAAMDALPADARPAQMMRAKNGAIYAKLRNGCEIIVMEKHSAPVVSVQGWMRTGGIDEFHWQGAGLSHFCEHMMFKGTTTRPTGVLDQEIRGSGGDDNAYTDSERTVYYITTQASGFDTSFNVLADMLMDSTFPPDEAKKEHKVVYKEIELRTLDNPDGTLNDVFMETLYQVHPYRIPVLGYPDRFQRVTRDDVYAYYQERYSPDNCCFIAVGDVEAQKVMPQMATTLAKWVRKSVPPATIEEEPEQLAPRFVQITHPLCQVPKLMLGYPGIPERHDDLYAMDLLASILGDGRSSRLYREVKDKGLVTDIAASDYTPIYKGFFMVNASADAGKIDAARAAILKVLEDAKKIPPTPEELARAKQKMKTARVMAQMTCDGLASALGSDWFVAGDLDFSDQYVDRIQKVEAAEIMRVAAKYLLAEKLNAVVMLPKEEAKKEAVAEIKNTAAAMEAALENELKTLQADDSIDGVSLLKDKAVFEFKLKANGLRAVVREDRALPLVSVSVAALGGTRWEPADLGGAGNLLGEMLDRGTASRDKFQIAETWENLGATFGSFSGRSSFGVNATSLTQDAPKMLDLAADCMLHPSFPDAELAQLKEETLQAIEGEDESIATMNNKILRPLLYDGHPYSRQTLGTKESVKKITVADLKKLHADWVHPENLAVSFVGDISAVDALKLIRARFGELKAGGLKAPNVPPIPKLTKGMEGEGTKEGIKGAVLTLGFQGADLKNPDRESLDLIANLLSGLGGRLSVALREKKGLAYEITVYNDSQLDGGAIIFFIRTDAKSLAESLEGMWKEVKLLRDEPVQAKELNSIKTYLSGSEAIELQNQSGVAQRLALAQLYGEGAAHVFSRKDRLEKVTPEQLQAIAKKYLDPEHWAKAILKAKE